MDTTNAFQQLYEANPEWTFSLMQITGFFIIVSVFVFASAIGVNGAGLLVPLMIFFFNVEPKITISVSFFVGILGSTIQFILNINTKHPTRKWAIACNYELIMLMLPVVLWGSLLGRKVILFMSDISLISCLMVVLLYNAYKTGQKFILEYREEERRFQGNNSLQKSHLNEASGLIVEDHQRNIQLESEKLNGVNINDNEFQQAKLNIIKEENTHLRCDYITKTVLEVLVVIFFSFLVSNEDYFEWITPKIKIASLLVFTVLTALMTLYEVKTVKKKHELKDKINYGYDQNDFDFSKTSYALLVQGVGFLGGFISGSLGPGGIVIASLLLQLNIHPLVLRCSMPPLQVIFGFALASLAMVDAQYNLKYTLIGMLGCSIGTVIGIKGITKITTQTGRSSYAILALEMCFIASITMLGAKLFAYIRDEGL